MKLPSSPLMVALALCAYGQSACAKHNPEDAGDALQIARKVLCSTVDGEPVTYNWTGYLYARRQGERDKRLFAIEGMNIRACVKVQDDERGEGFKLLSREIMLYKDATTGEVLSKWDNPWTGETVNVLHVANDPVNFTSYEIGRNGNPAPWGGEIHGEQWFQSIQVPLYYPNPLASEYQAEIGGTYHATEMFNFYGSTRELLSERETSVPVHVGWTRISDWLPWMRMSGREGVLYVHAAGKKLGSWDDLSDTMKGEIRKHYPDYTAPPPLDDARRNETSWIYYKRLRDGERTAPTRE